MQIPALKRILCVEDDEDIRSVARLSLERVGGFSVQMCANGADAVARAAAFAPDLVLLDVLMPGMDGPQTLAALRALPELRSTPVVFMTAQAQKADLDRYVDLGAAGTVTKPFDPLALPQQLHEIWDHCHA